MVWKRETDSRRWNVRLIWKKVCEELCSPNRKDDKQRPSPLKELKTWQT